MLFLALSGGGGPHPARPSSTCGPGCPQAQGSLRSRNSAVLAQPRGPDGQEGPRLEWTHGGGRSWGHQALEEAAQPGGQGGPRCRQPPDRGASRSRTPAAHPLWARGLGPWDPGRGAGSPLMGRPPQNSALWAWGHVGLEQQGPQGCRRGKDSSSVFLGRLLPHQVLSGVIAEATCIPLGVQPGPRAVPGEGSPQTAAWAEERRPPRTTAWRLRDG